MKLFLVCLMFCLATAVTIKRAKNSVSNSAACDTDAVSYNGWCYTSSTKFTMYYNPKVIFEGAAGRCRLYGGDLVSIHGGGENDFLRSRFPNILIGIKYDGKAFHWSDGSTVDYKNLKSNFVGMVDYYGYCAVIGSTGLWENAECDTETYDFICKKKPSEYTDSTCPDPDAVHFDDGYIYSMSYPLHYHGTDSSCVWKLAAKNEMYINIRFEYYTLGTNDQIDIYGGWNYQTHLGSLSGYGSSTNFNSGALNRMLVVLTTEKGNTGYFRANWDSHTRSSKLANNTSDGNELKISSGLPVGGP